MNKTPKMHEWVKYVEDTIARHSSAPAKRGKFKGHGQTDSGLAFTVIAGFVAKYVEIKYRGQMVDGNLATAMLLGKILLAWSMNCARAKTMDPNRPLKLRRRAVRRLQAHRAEPDYPDHG